MLTLFIGMIVAIVALYCQLMWCAWHDDLEEVTWL